MTARRLTSHPAVGRLLAANGAVAVCVAVGGVLAGRLAPDVPSGLLAVLVAVAGLAVAALVNYVLVRTTLRQLIDMSLIVEAIHQGVDPHVATEGGPIDPALSTVSAALMETVDRLEHEARRYSSRLLTSIEDERRRIGRELHDETSQTLAATLINLDLVEKGLGDCPEGVRERVVASKELIRHTMEQLKLLIYDLRPAMLDDLGLVPALRWYIRSHLGASDLRVEVDFEGTEERIAAETETALYRIAQESLANVVKHAGATRVSVRLEIRPGYASFAVHDDGVGFDPDEVLADRAEQYGLGLLSIRERAELLGGTVNIVSNCDGGTHVYVVVPLREDGHERQ
jgi:two-component system, NarL family, sensor histidine kinase UhpB